MSSHREIDFNDKRKLIDALLECACMKKQQSRNQVVDDLPNDIKYKIERQPNDRQDVGSIVTACLSHTGDIECLLTIVEYYEQDSLAWRRLVEVNQRVLNQDPLDRIGQSLADSLNSHGGIAPDQQIEIKKQIKELKRDRAQSAPANERNGHLNKVMHEINFTEVQAFLDHGDRQSEQAGFASLCLIQRSAAYGGDLCLKRIQDRMTIKEREPDKISITPPENTILDERTILGRLAAKFEVSHPGDDLSNYSRAIIRKICDSIHIGRRYLIVIRQWEDCYDPDAMLSWFLDDFWRPLAQSFHQNENRLQARLMVVIMTDHPVNSGAFINQSCGLEDFHCEKIVSLELRPWTQPELLNWLVKYWAEILRLSMAELKKLAEKIYLASDGGRPPLICSQVMKYLLRGAA